MESSESRCALITKSVRHRELLNGKGIALSIAGLSLLALIAKGQSHQVSVLQPAQPAGDLPTIKVDVDVVNILTTVRDKRGALIPNLKKEDFTVLEDGKAQPIKYFTRETDLPLTIGLLIDVSVSQRDLIEIERDAATQFFFQVLGKEDKAFLMAFAEDAQLLQDYTNSAKLLTQMMRGLPIRPDVGNYGPSPVHNAGAWLGVVSCDAVPTAGTVLYDAVYLAATEKLQGEMGRKVIIVITDGVDAGSRLRVDDAVRAAQKTDAVIYSIEYYDPRSYCGFAGGGGYAALHRMSDETGGRVYKAGGNHTLEVVFSKLQDEMRNQYAIGYTPINETKDGSYHHLRIKLANKDLSAQARKGYYTVKPESK